MTQMSIDEIKNKLKKKLNQPFNLIFTRCPEKKINSGYENYNDIKKFLKTDPNKKIYKEYKTVRDNCSKMACEKFWDFWFACTLAGVTLLESICTIYGICDQNNKVIIIAGGIGCLMVAVTISFLWSSFYTLPFNKKLLIESYINGLEENNDIFCFFNDPKIRGYIDEGPCFLDPCFDEISSNDTTSPLPLVQSFPGLGPCIQFKE